MVRYFIGGEAPRLTGKLSSAEVHFILMERLNERVLVTVLL